MFLTHYAGNGGFLLLHLLPLALAEPLHCCPILRPPLLKLCVGCSGWHGGSGGGGVWQRLDGHCT